MSTYKNAIILKGFLGKDAEQPATTNQKAITVLSLATKTSYKDKQSSEFVSRTEWHRIVAFGRLAESARTLTKGTYVEIKGELQSHEYTAQSDNKKRRSWEVRATSVSKLVRPPKARAEDVGAQPEPEAVPA